MGEFGRTPRMNKDAGRDHWGNTFSVLMGCGSMRMGQVIGRSSDRGRARRRPADQPAGRRRDGLPPPRHRRPLGHLRGPDRAADLPDRERRADPRTRRQFLAGRDRQVLVGQSVRRQARHCLSGLQRGEGQWGTWKWLHLPRWRGRVPPLARCVGRPDFRSTWAGIEEANPGGRRGGEGLRRRSSDFQVPEI